MAKDLFHKDSLEKLSSPEQLNRLLVVVRLKGWVVLSAVMMLIAAVLVWSLIGRVPVTVSGKGIAFDANALITVRSRVAGIVDKVAVRAGETVKTGDLLVTLENEKLLMRLKNQKEIVAALEKLADAEVELISNQGKLEILEQEVRDLKVVAPKGGQLIEVNVSLSEPIERGQELFWIQAPSKNEEKIEVHAFFPVEKAKRIKKGMNVEMEFAAKGGLIQGKVSEVFPYAISEDAQQLTGIPSKALRDYLTSNGPTVLVKIMPTSKVTPGSIATVRVFIEEKRPIAYLLPERQ